MTPNHNPQRFAFCRRKLLLTAVVMLVAACAGNDEREEPIGNLNEAYDTARQSIGNGNFRRGIEIFESIQARYPFSDLSRQIQLELMYAYYKSGEPERAIDAADTFVRENPIHPRVDYALYIKALAYFEGDPGFLERWFKRDMSKRPPEGVDQAYATLRRLVERYPASPYAEDAHQREPAVGGRRRCRDRGRQEPKDDHHRCRPAQRLLHRSSSFDGVSPRDGAQFRRSSKRRWQKCPTGCRMRPQ